jgi:hypothetical protein
MAYTVLPAGNRIVLRLSVNSMMLVSGVYLAVVVDFTTMIFFE